MDNFDYQQKYLKYKKKYLDLKEKLQFSGASKSMEEKSNDTEIVYGNFPLPNAILKFKDSRNMIAKLTLDWAYYVGGIYFTIYIDDNHQWDRFELTRGKTGWKDNIDEIRRLSENPEYVTNFKRLSFEISNKVKYPDKTQQVAVNKLKEITDTFV